ncbi:MAG: CvpA family protein [Spirochaetes bacterium]|nr:CvpA family protein [Spirochaetota bacterium]
MLNKLDLIIVGIIVIFMIQSFRAGFLGEILSLAVFALSGYLAYILHPLLVPYLEFISGNNLVVKVCTMIIIFIVFYIVGKIAKSFIFDLIDENELNGFDKVMGMILGLLKGAVIISLVILLISYLQLSLMQNLLDSSLISNKILYAISKYKGLIVI